MTTKLNKLLLTKYKNYTSVNPLDYSTETELLNEVAKKLNSGTDTLELKTFNVNSGNAISIARKIRELTAVFDALFIIHDRIDIAKLVEADGISLDDNTIEISDAKRLVEDSMLIGVHCDLSDKIDSAIIENADFIVSSTDKVSDKIKIFNVKNNS